MRTLPSKFSTDLSAGTKDLFYLFVVTTDSTSYYWHTSSATFSLWPNTAASHGGSELTKDAGRIAGQLNNERVPYPQISAEISFVNGGGIGAVANTTLVCLNQDRLDQTLTALNLKNRTVEIRKGFVDTVNGTGVNDMLLVKTFVIDSVQYDYSQLTLELVDGSFLRHRDIPNIVIDKETYPLAPSDSIDKVVPVVYGDFQTFNTTAVYTNGGNSLYKYHFGKVECAPVVVVSEVARVVAVSELQLYSTDTPIDLPQEGIVGIMSGASATISSGYTSAGFVKFIFSGTIYVDYFLLPISPGSYLSAGSLIAAYPWENAVDDDNNTYASDLTSSGNPARLFGEVPWTAISGVMQNISGSSKLRAFLVWAASSTDSGSQNVVGSLYVPQNPPGSQINTFVTESCAGGGSIAKHLTVNYETLTYPLEGIRVEDLLPAEFGIGAAVINMTLTLYLACLQVRIKWFRVGRNPRSGQGR